MLTLDITDIIQAAIDEKREQSASEYCIIEQIPQGEELTWKVTPEQIARINAGDRQALDEFFLDKDNYRRISCCGWAFFRRTAYFRTVVSIEDLINQVYVDLRAGFLKLRPWNKAIGGALYHSFRFAAVGGLDEVYIYKGGRKKCRN